MNVSDKTAALIVDGSAGFDSTAALYTLSPLRRLIAIFRQAGIRRIIIAACENTDAVSRNASKLGADLLLLDKNEAANADECVIAGLNHLHARYTRAFITPANFPLFEAETVEKLCCSEADITVPLCNNERGYPILVAWEMFDELKNHGGSINSFLNANSKRVSTVRTTDIGTITDVSKSSGADIETIARNHSLHTKLRPSWKFGLSKEDAFFGPGVFQLITLVDEVQSVKAARLLMGMVTSRMQKIVRDAEDNLGFKLFRYAGNPRKSYLTPECREFVERYSAYADDCERAVNEAFDKHFSDYKLK
jgi:CTP:molybdopterin cytidylyltransferase MocA/molybdenum-dependent DNA-binding transcriptional regulator ModE